jgi:hypothetical protein
MGIYSISIRDCYKTFTAPGSSFITDTSAKGTIRAVTLENTYSEINACTDCREVALSGKAGDWDVRANETFTNGPGLQVSPYRFASGLYDSFIFADTTGSAAGMLEAPSCRGSIINTGPQNGGLASVRGCHDFMQLAAGGLIASGYPNSVQADNGTVYPLRIGATFTKVDASIGAVGVACSFLLVPGSHGAQVLYGTEGACGTASGAHLINAYWNGSDYVIQQTTGSQHIMVYGLSLLN